MPQDRLRDDDGPWGKSRVEYALQDRRKNRDLIRARRSRYLNTVKIRERDEKGMFVASEPVDNPSIWALKSQEGQELGIIAIAGSAVDRRRGSTTAPTLESRIAVSLPYVTFLYGSLR
jgi:hypothetical protein